MTSLTSLRKRNKQRYAECLKYFTSSPKFSTFLERKLGKGYKLVQYNNSYKHQSLQILAYQFSSMGGTNHAKALMLSVSDHYTALEFELDHLQKTGLGLVLIDKNNNVCMITYCWDQVDMPNNFIIKNDNYQKKYEICSAALKNDKEYQRLILSKNNLKYGDIIYVDKVAIRPDMLNKRLFYVALSYFFFATMNYKCFYILHTNHKTIIWGDKVSKRSQNAMQLSPIIINKRTSYFDFSNFIFKDGTSMKHCYKKLKEANLDGKKYQNVVAILFGYYDTSKKVTIKQVFDFWYILVNLRRTANRSKL